MYTAPNHSACNLNFTIQYTTPTHANANFNFGVGGVFGPDTERRRKFLIGAS